MILVKKVGALYDRCSSIEINDFSRSVIRVNSLDSFTMSEASISSREELKLAVESAVLKIYLKDEVVLSDELVRLFENNMQLGGNQISYSDTLIMYSNVIVSVLYENGYEDGLLEDAINFFIETGSR